ncbi:MAG: CDP-alcohol phosphatidyltransferase family protein [Gemmatimonadetes bacterium]|nr:CDP-alcohol phosphatidyltransferase family protein [Gemmatimonadota bacterium]
MNPLPRTSSPLYSHAYAFPHSVERAPDSAGRAQGLPPTTWYPLIVTHLKSLATRILRPLVQVFIKLGFRPDWLTLFGLLMNIVATGAFAVGELQWGAAIMLSAGLCDILDGQLAREGRSETKFGALLDSTTDRYSEIFLFFGIAAYLVRRGEWLVSSILFFALAGSLMVSYVRARAEGLGEDCKVGFMQRPERLVGLAIGGLLGHEGLVFVLVVLAVTTNYTVIERLAYIRNKLNNPPSPSGSPVSPTGP